MLILIIITMYSILVIAGVVILPIELTRKKDKNKDSKEQSEEKDTNPTSIVALMNKVQTMIKLAFYYNYLILEVKKLINFLLQQSQNLN